MLPMLRSVAPSLLTWLALISVLIVVVEATGPVPGLRWDRLQVWEGSAAHADLSGEVPSAAPGRHLLFCY